MGNINYFNIGIFSLLVLGIGIYYYRKYCNHQTFKNIEKNYKKTLEWENKLDIYEISMPIFYTCCPKKPKCILLIGGYKDIPYVWSKFQNYLISDGYDFYAPRTFGNGRSFFQVCDYKDWIITYLEAIYILGEQYESVDIISFSMGTVIALYLSQFQYKCKINNIFLCSPFLLYKSCLSMDLFFSQNIFSKILNRIYAWTIRFHPKSTGKFAGFRDTYFTYNSINDYCEIFGDFMTETTLIEFSNFRPKKIIASNIVILYSEHDDVIGNINDQYKIISNVFEKPIDLISIPSYVGHSNSHNLPQKCGHVMFKEHPDIIFNLYLNIKKYL